MIQLLDCTLRDGGYINDWEFGNTSITNITNKLIASKIDIIEYGFLANKNISSDKTRYDSVTTPLSNTVQRCVMVEQGGFTSEQIPERSADTCDMIRFIFKPGAWNTVEQIAKETCKKGYSIAINPMLTSRYSDRELLELIDEINKLDVYCLAIVDTFGSITQAKLAHLFRLIDHNLNPAIRIGYHAHNNLQLAFANAIEIINLHGKRDIVLDCSCYGIGRGAGNLPTELIVNYLNQQQGEEIYNLSPILDTIDLDILPIFREKAWGYSSHHALSGMLDLHPNYATFLFNQQRLTVAAIQEILACIEKDKQVNYDERYISELYRHHQAKLVNDDSSLKTIQANLRNTILFVAPGASTKEHLEKIEAFIREENPLVVAINFEPQQIKADYLFFGNQLRFDQYARAASTPVLVSSNINVGNADVAVINYADLISKTQTTEIDNSGLMALRLFLRVGATSFNLAGFDGFSVNQNNYADDVQSFFSEAAIIANRNLAIIKQLDEIKKTANVTFFTPSIYKDSI